MARILRRTPLRALLRYPHEPRRTRPRGHRPEHRINSGPRRYCVRGHECPCRPRYLVATVRVPAVLLPTQFLPTVERER